VQKNLLLEKNSIFGQNYLFACGHQRHRAEIMMILLIFGNIHQCRHIKQGEKFQAFWCYQMTQISTNT
jgi:hypothetical protein